MAFLNSYYKRTAFLVDFVQEFGRFDLQKLAVFGLNVMLVDCKQQAEATARVVARFVQVWQADKV